MSSVYSSATSDDEEQMSGIEKKFGIIGDDERATPPPVNVPFKKGTVKDLSPAEVRWFYRSSKSSNFIAFKGRDSLLIEVKRRILLNEPISENFPMKQEILAMCSRTIVVLDGYYELAFEEMKINPIYWAGHSMDIMRGSWFTDTDWSPLEESLASEIEQQHVKMFNGQNIPESPVYSEKGQKPILHTLFCKNCKVEWNSIIDIIIQPKDRTWIMSLRLKSTTTKVRRGYHTEATFDDGPLPVNHLLLVVHGIGQKRLVNQIIANTNAMRTTADKLMKQSYSNVQHRALFLPVEWRLNLKLDEDVIESITPNHLQYVRSFLNNTAMDIMYYSSPKYRAELAAGIVTVFNRTYSTFLSHNPYFEKIGGKVSIVAHSLGSVLSYDVITNWSPLVQYEEYVSQRLDYLINSNLLGSDLTLKLKNLQKCRKDLEEAEGGLMNLIRLVNRDSTHLRFQVANLFSLGSPLSVFLALRGQKGHSIFENFTPAIFNVFNANDPVAYRLEPLVHPLYAKVCPLRIHKFDSKNQTPYNEMPIELMNAAKSSPTTGTAVTAAPPVDKDLKRKKLSAKLSIEVGSVAVPTSTGTQDESKVAAAIEQEIDPQTDLPKRSWSAAVLSKFRSSPTPTLKSAVAAYNSLSAADAASSDQAAQLKAVSFDLSTNSATTSDATTTSDVKVAAENTVVENAATDADLLSSLSASERLPYRLDYVVKASTISLLDTMLSHTNYWQKEDIVMFILTQLYGIPPENIAKS